MATPTPARPATASSLECTRLLVTAARLYHVQGLRQREIGLRLGLSQARVSRLLRQAVLDGLVRTVVAVPEGLRPELEEAVESSFGVPEVHVVECAADGDELGATLGRAAAAYFAEVPPTGQIIGFTSWSRTLQQMAHALRPTGRRATTYVVEMLGDLGSPSLQHAADRATQAMARALGAQPVFLRVPGVVATPALRETVTADPHVSRALSLLDALDVAFVGVGPADVHSSLQAGDLYFTPSQLEHARLAGAAGQLNQRFYDGEGCPVVTPLDELVVGSTLAQVRSAKQRVVVAGGPVKVGAIAAALRGGWVDALFTDVHTAAALVAVPGTRGAAGSPPRPLPAAATSF